MKKSTKLLMGLVSVCLVAGIGVFIYTRLHKEDTKLASSTASSQATTQQPVTSTGETPAQTVKPTNQFDIPELGVSLQPPGGLAGLQYSAQKDKVAQDRKDIRFSIAYFTTKSLKDLAGTNGTCSADTMPLGAITRFDVDPDSLGTRYAAKQAVGSFFLVYTYPRSGCSDKPEVAQLATSQSELLKTTLQSAAALK